MTLTKEWLLKTIAELENERDAIPGSVNEDAANALAAMKLALASLEAEPVAFIGQRMLEELTDGARSCGRVWPEVTDKLSDENRIPLYTAPPAPVVPDAIEMDDDFDSAFEHGKAVGWNACRAAILQGGAGNSPAIPDGWVACSERMPEDAQWCAVNTEYGYYVQCWSDGQGWLGDEISIPNCDVTHWMPLPAAPKQEVKS